MINSCILHGNLAKDPVTAASKNGKPICKFTVAVNRLNEGCDYFNVITFGSLAEACSKYLQKGSEAMISGRLQSESYEKNGVKQFYINILADSVDFGARTKAQVQQNVQPQTVPQQKVQPQTVPQQNVQQVMPQQQVQPQTVPQQVMPQQTKAQVQQTQQNIFAGDIDSICLP